MNGFYHASSLTKRMGNATPYSTPKPTPASTKEETLGPGTFLTIKEAHERFIGDGSRYGGIHTLVASEVQPKIKRWEAEAKGFGSTHNSPPRGYTPDVTVIFGMGRLSEEQQKEVRQFYKMSSFDVDKLVFVHEDSK